MSAEALREQLEAMGVAAGVEARGRVALVTPRGPVALDAPARRRLVAAARQHGFSNICVELSLSEADPSRS